MINLPTNEYNPYYSGYIQQVKNDSLLAGLEESFEETLLFLKAIPDDKWDYSYSFSEGKWTVKEVVQHILDTERVFAYRALCFARKDKVKLPGFDQDDYLSASFANDRSKDDIIDEYISIRKATITLFKSFTDDMLRQIGVASDNPLSTRAAGFIIIGHEKHHCNIIQERYL